MGACLRKPSLPRPDSHPKEVPLLESDHLTETSEQFGGKILLSKVKDPKLRKVPITAIPISEVKLQKKIGDGAFGVVYKGMVYGRPVAVKEVCREGFNQKALKGHSTLTSRQLSSMAQTNLLSEAAILSSVRHPNIVAFLGLCIVRDDGSDGSLDSSKLSELFGSWTHNGSSFLTDVPSTSMHKSEPKVSKYYFVTELCSMPLDAVASGWGKVEGSELWQILTQVAAGMAYLHEKGIVHRDLKPANVLVTCKDQEFTASGRSSMTCEYKVCDFGLSRLQHDLDEIFNLGTSMTASSGGRPGMGTLNYVQRAITGGVGTPAYMAPELITEEEKGIRAANPFAVDVYSFGIMIWCLMAGTKPYRGPKFHNKSAHRIMLHIVDGLRPEIPKQWPKGIVALTKNCWDGKAKNRPTFAEVLKILHGQKLRDVFHASHPPA